MLRRDRFDERTADAVLSGRGGQVEGDEVADLAAFVTTVRAEATTAPARPNAMLAEVLAHGISADKGELPVTAASNVNGPATQVSGPPKRRIRTMLESIAASFAALSLAAKAGIAGAAVVATTAGAGAAGVLPETLQDPFDDAVGGAEVPEVDLEEVGVDDPGTAEKAREGGLDGKDVADDASDGRSSEGLDQADEASDDKSSDREDNASELPEETDNASELPEEADNASELEEADSGELPAEADQGEPTTDSDAAPVEPPVDADQENPSDR